MRRITVSFFIVFVFFFGGLAHAQKNAHSLVLEGEKYMDQGNWSRAKWSFQQAVSSIDPDDYDNDKAFYEHLLNDLTECQIRTEDCASAYIMFAFKVPCETPKEELRHLHLECLFWQRSIVERSFGKETARARKIECAEKASKMLAQYRKSLTKAEARRFEIDIMNDLLEAYEDAGDSGKIKTLLSRYESLAGSVPYSDKAWSWRYYKHKADALRDDGKTNPALELYVKVLNFCLEYDLENAYVPFIIICEIYLEHEYRDKTHEILRAATDIIRNKSLEQYRRMCSAERYTSWLNNTSVRLYRVFPMFMSEGYFEDVLYDAALYSKNVMMDIGLEESGCVWGSRNGFDMDFFHLFRLRQMFAGTDESLAAEWEFKDALAKRNPVFSRMDYSWKDVQKNLRNNDMAVEIVRTGGSFEDYSAVLIRKGWSMPKYVKLCTQSDLDALGMDPDIYRGSRARKGYDLLVRPLERYLKPGDNVFFSPEGTTCALNIGAFVDASGKCASDKYEFYQVTTTRKLSRDNRPARYDQLLLFGDMDYYCDISKMRENSEKIRARDHLLWYEEVKTQPLEGLSFGENRDGTRAGLRHLDYSRVEVDNIAGVCPPGTEVSMYTGNDAIEEQFKACAHPLRLNNKVIYHVATHSFAREDSDSELSWLSAEELAFKRSGLMFSGSGYTADGRKLPAGVNDGMLYAEEIAALDMLNADMVVLSACNTALGEYSQNGVLGLQRAFKNAGCNTIVMTLWNVNDRATSLFMTIFYRNLFSGVSKHDSFTRAQKAVRDEYEDPYYWAPFVMLD